MREDLDREMKKRGVEAIVVFGDTTLGNPDLTYVVGGALARGGVYFKRAEEKPLLVTSNLDIGSARKLRVVRRIETYTDWGYEKLAAKHGRANALPHLISEVIRSHGVRGRTVLFGRNDLASGLYLANCLREIGITIAGEPSPTILETARETKSAKELQNIRAVGSKTTQIVHAVIELLRNAKTKRNHLMVGRTIATVGNLKRIVSSELAARDLIAPEGMIFAIGPSAADPHSPGKPADSIRKGKLIVFDIFPQSESGYWFDLTRSFVVGRAEKKATRLYAAVSDAHRESLEFIRAGRSGEAAMLRACSVIERHGFRTIRELYRRKATSAKSGFIHSLGHGVGLTIGERPYLSFLSKERLKVGQVVTVEPGVYLPGYGGVRIEDTVAITSKGVDNLSQLDREFEVT